ncbi:hypothetical protein, partial [Mycobacterium sp.]|uniref:hypothetical protein n=1 Tax=Mycobacterium sp. TaxID=1785 RepID=UPI003F973D2C
MSEDHDRHPVGRRAVVRDKTARAATRMLPGRAPDGRGRPNPNTRPRAKTVRPMTGPRSRRTSKPD